MTARNKRQSNKRQNRFLFFGFLITSILGIFTLAHFVGTYSHPVGISNIDQAPESAKVLGGRNSDPVIHITDREWGSNGGMISLSSVDDPSVVIRSWDLDGTADVELYRANQADLINYLVHDSEGKQTNPKIDTNKLEHIKTLKHNLNKDDNQLLLPLDNTGLYALKVTLGKNTAYAIIVRSNIGSLLKEGDNEYIFWSQDYTTKRSIDSGTVRIFSLEHPFNLLTTSEIDSQGIATTELFANADVALVEKGQDVAVVPINLQYLNSSSSYSRFEPKKLNTRYFVFTDRPLYKPGDTVYFKAILRDEDDVKYTIPQGTAKVTITQGYGDNLETIYKKDLPINAHGGIDDLIELKESANTGYYNLKVDTGREENSGWGYWSSASGTSFQVEHYRKPEYTLEANVNKKEVIAGDEVTFTVQGNYFFGQPVSDQNINYTVRSSNYHTYDYWNGFPKEISDDYAYGSWQGTNVADGYATLDENGQAQVTIPTKVTNGRNQVYSFTATFKDESGNNVFTRKNILVYAGEFDLYRQSSRYGHRVGGEIDIPLKLVAHNSENVANKTVTSTVNRTTWEEYQDDSKKYPQYNRIVDKLDDISTKTNSQGEASLKLRADKAGSYDFEVSVSDDRGNLIQRKYYAWVSKEGSFHYYKDGQSNLTIEAEKEEYQPDESAVFTIQSRIPDRDIFLSMERQRVNRYQIVHLTGQQAVVTVPLVNTDMPNIFAKVSGFDPEQLDNGIVDLAVSAERKRMQVEITPNAKTYGPGETTTLDISTKDINGNPISSEVTVWAVDKALFELVDQPQEDIFDEFWTKRWNDTQQAHSLESIVVLTAEMGGGCFAANTQILMADGSQKDISQIKSGESVLTFASENSSRLIKSKVLSTHQRQSQGYMIINDHLRVTANHKMWVNSSWKDAGSIQVGDILRDADSKAIEVESVAWQYHSIPVFNLEVEKQHTYIANNIYVHNQKGGEARETLEDTAYWNPRVITDESGSAQVSFELPDNLTTWVVAATGSTKDTAVGQTTSEVMVTKDVVIRPIIPNILRQNDQLTLKAQVHNFTDIARNFKTSLEFKDGEVSQAQQDQVLIHPSQSHTFSWIVKPNQVNSNSQLKFSAWDIADEQLGDVLVANLPVLAFGYNQARGEAKTGDASYSIQFAPDVDLDNSSLSVSVAPSLIATLPSAMDYLIGYPYGCVEQTTSKFTPAVIASSNLDIFPDAFVKKDMDKIVDQGVSRLKSHQQSDGGWSWWSRGSSDPFVTAYVIEYLLGAKNTGFEVDEIMLQRAYDFFNQESYLSDTEGGKKRVRFIGSDLVAKNYALSLYSQDNKYQITQELDKLENDLLAWAVITNLRSNLTDPNQNGLNLLLSRAQTQGDAVFWESASDRRFGTKGSATAMALRAIAKSNTNRDTAVKTVRYIERNRKNSYWGNTFETLQTIQALVDFSRTGSELNPNYTAKIYLDDNLIGSKHFSDPHQDYKLDLDVNKIKPNGSNLRVERDGEGQLYSTLISNSWHTSPDALVEDKGLQISRKYLNKSKPQHTLGIGATARVQLTIEGLSSSERYAVIKDELPSGMVPINPVFKNESYNNKNYSWMWQRNVSGRDTTLSGMVISLSSLGSGKHVIEYEARVINAGTFTAPPASVELMYAPEIWGRSNIESITIPEVSAFDPNAPNPQKYQAAPNYSSDQSNEDINLDEMSSFKAMIYRIKNLINPLNRFIARYWVIIGSLLIVILLGLLWYLRKQRLIKTPQNKEANPTKPETNVPQADSISNNLSPDSAKPPTQSPNDEQEISGS